MNRFTRVLVLLFLLSQSGAIAAPDYSELQAAVKDYAAAVNKVADESAGVNDREGAAKVLADWTAANNALADKVLNFGQRNPEVMKGAIPPQMQAIKDKITRFKSIHPDLRKDVSFVAKRFDMVDSSTFLDFSKSQARIDHLGEEESRLDENSGTISFTDSFDQPDGSFPLSLIGATPSGSSSDMAGALDQWRKAAGANPPDEAARQAENNLAVCYWNGLGTPKDPAEAMRWVRKAAEHGVPEAQTCLGRFLLFGLGGLAKNEGESLAWYKKAAEQGDVEAMLMTANAYKCGKGTKRDMATAAQWIRKTAERGVPLAEVELGMLYLETEGVQHDPVEGFKWIQKAANTGNKYGELLMAGCCYYGAGTARDKATGISWLRKAAEHGLAQAEGVLATLLSVGNFGNQTNADTAMWAGRNAAVDRNADTEGALAAWMKTESGVDRNETEAAAWMKKAAEQGAARAEYSYGYKCLHGTGRPVDIAEATRWFRAAALQGLPLAANNYGYALQRGQGVDQDFVEAYKWLTLAINQRDNQEAHDRASVNMQDLLPHMTPEQIQEGKDRAAHFVPVLEHLQPNAAVEAAREMKQKTAATVAGAPTPTQP